MLIQHPKGASFRYAQPSSDTLGNPTTRGAQKFPSAASVRISLSNVKSDTTRRKRSFSLCNRFNSLSWSVLITPYRYTRGLPDPGPPRAMLDLAQDETLLARIVRSGTGDAV